MKIAKIFSLLVVLALVLGCVCSCGTPDAKKLIDDATQAMLENPHSVTMNMTFASDNEEIGALLKASSTEGLKIDFDGEDMHFSMDMAMGAAKTTMDYTLVDGVLYLKGVVNAYGQTQTIKSKATLSDEEYEEFTSEMDYSLDLDPDDFASVSVEQNGDTYVISCLGFTEKLNEAMDEIASGITDTFEGDVEITEASYVVEIKDGKADSAALFCAYKISVSGETVEFSLSLDLEYDYSNPVSVTAPADADSYVNVDYSEIAG